ncbi:coiled-coil alpha-helical rod protein 1 [Myotis lucifugus]|uniref:coiled-coil alpha-helical rod protein 1 n=1 Tax=Myotis lucifugus TaxID=59463 RepID=UPI000CCC09C1|nr:coiled-coil alpha-helical rod protein 1 [Myotis lucifugus]
MRPHPSGARPWASALVGRDPGVLAWCVDGLPPGLAEPWRGLWSLGSQPLHRTPSSPATRNGRVRRNLRRRGNVDGWTQDLEAPNNVEMFRPSGSTGLIPPSHFQARPLPAMPRMAPSWVSDIPLAHRGVSERWPDFQRPPGNVWEQDISGDGQEPGWRDRSVELQGSQALRQQAELISRQLQEVRRLEEEVRVLQENSLEQKMKLETQAMELEALARAEKAGRAEAEGLRAALAGAEVVRKNLEEGSQRELEEVQRLHQEQLSSLTRAHQEALSSLTSKAEGLEKSLTGLETSRAGEAKELAMAQREAELLREQLSKTQQDLEAQVTLVEKLRRYVGEQVPPEIHDQAWESERLKLLETVQHLQEDRDGLHTTAELLQVRVQSLTYILSMQEEELARKVQPSDSLEPEFSRKSQALLKHWREKVFALMVQLKAQELEHGACVQQLKGQVAEFQERVAAQSQEQAILQRSLEDKAAQVEVERMGAKSLQMELSRAQEACRRGQQQTASAEEQLKRVAKAINSFQTWIQNPMAEVEQAAARLPSLSSRVSYAVRKVHTIQGLMARKLVLAQLRQESFPSGLREVLFSWSLATSGQPHTFPCFPTVVSLGQMQRKATREKERNQELRRLQEEARKEEGLRLTQRLQELQRDKNLLLATLQQEGLLSRYKQQRLLAVLDKGGSVRPSPRPAGPSAPAPPAAALGPRAATKESLSVLLDDLQSLSEAISKEEAVSQGDNQNSPAARGSECLGAQGGPAGQEDREMG